MPFRVMARTVLHLGAELISSDAVALYELIKNAFDANSPRVAIRVVVRLPQEAMWEANGLIAARAIERQSTKEHLTAIAECGRSLIARVDPTAPAADTLRDELAKVESWDDLKLLLDEANFIEIADTGSGMSLHELDEVFLTIGTRARFKERKAGGALGGGGRAVLGEKGLGRLSAMRLGWKLQVFSSKGGEESWNVLEVDWRLFSHESDAMIEAIDIRPMTGEKKVDAAASGTRIRISALTAGWNADKLVAIAADEFSKLTDPFVPEARYPISLSFNGRPVTIPAFDRLLFKYAHAQAYAEFRPDGNGGPRLSGHVKYKQREKTFELEGTHLISTVRLPSFHVLRSLGPFTTQFVWFNRGALEAIEDNIEELRRVKKLQSQWAGGLMVYRDGFRVYPYGSPDDDWLNVDKKALASGGYKVNRRQVIGKVNISSNANPALLDQSNREGLRDSSEKQAIILLLKYVFETEFRAFLNNVDKELRASEPTTFDNLEDRIGESEERIDECLQMLVERHPAVEKDTGFVTALRDTVKDLRRRLKEARALAESFESKHAQIVHLAATGLLVEMLAHELNRATANTLATLTDMGHQQLSPQATSLVATLQSELKTLQRRLRILDPLSTAGRHRKETFDLAEWVGEVLATHDPQFQRHGITYAFRTKPKGGTLRIKAVKGMIVQILANLVSNSVYWLKQERKLNRSLKAEITVVIDTARKAVRFSDNGPGIPVARKEDVFEPFVTTKPPGEGKGLGLYIAREVARYNHASLILADEKTVHTDRLNTFVLTLEDLKE